MARVKLQFPDKKPDFLTSIPVRVTDLNYGNHVGNDAILSIVHEARMQMLHAWGCSEMDLFGCGIIMADAAITFKNEGFYGDIFEVSMFVTGLTAVSFDVMYRLMTVRDKKTIPVAEVKTGIVCFDYKNRKVCEVPKAFREKLAAEQSAK